MAETKGTSGTKPTFYLAGPTAAHLAALLAAMGRDLGLGETSPEDQAANKQAIEERLAKVDAELKSWQERRDAGEPLPEWPEMYDRLKAEGRL